MLSSLCIMLSDSTTTSGGQSPVYAYIAKRIDATNAIAMPASRRNRSAGFSFSFGLSGSALSLATTRTVKGRYKMNMVGHPAAIGQDARNVARVRPNAHARGSKEMKNHEVKEFGGYDSRAPSGARAGLTVVVVRI